MDIPAGLFDRLLARQESRAIPPEVASFGDAVWLHTDMGPSSYLLRDGRMIVTDAFEPNAPPRFAGEDEITSVLVCGARNLSTPELLDLVPRPTDASDCTQCRGTRWWRLPIKVVSGDGIIVCPKCSGRGWARASDRSWPSEEP
jgi:hypothetical protein